MSEGQDNSFRGLGYSTLAKIANDDPQALRFQIMAAHHPDVVQGVISEEQAAAARANIAAANRGAKSGNKVAVDGGTFARGKVMLHRPSQTKVTIIQAAAGRKEGETVHEVVNNKTGKKFLARQSNLKPVS